MLSGKLKIHDATHDEEIKIKENDFMDCVMLWPLIVVISGYNSKIRQQAIDLISYLFCVPEKKVKEIIAVPCLDICCFNAAFMGILEELKKSKGEWRKEKWFIKKFLDPEMFPRFFDEKGEPILTN